MVIRPSIRNTKNEKSCGEKKYLNSNSYRSFKLKQDNSFHSMPSFECYHSLQSYPFNFSNMINSISESHYEDLVPDATSVSITVVFRVPVRNSCMLKLG